MYRSLALLVTLVMMCSTAQAQSDMWQSLNGPWGGSISDIDRWNGHYYASTPTGIYKANSIQGQWHFLSDMPTVTDQKKFAIDSQGGLWSRQIRNLIHSTDDGQTWDTAQTGLDGLDVITISASGDRMVASYAHLFAYSIDKGKSWVNPPLTGPHLGAIFHMEFKDEDDLLFNTSEGSFRYRIGEDTVYKYPLFPKLKVNSKLLKRPGFYIYSSTSQLSKQSYDAEFPTNNNFYDELPYIAIDSSNIVYTVWSGSLYSTSDYGLSWDHRFKMKRWSLLNLTFLEVIDGALIIGIGNEGLHRYVPEEDMLPYPINNGFSHTQVLHLSMNADGQLFTSSSDGGIGHYDPQTTQWETIHVDPTITRPGEALRFINLLTDQSLGFYYADDFGLKRLESNGGWTIHDGPYFSIGSNGILYGSNDVTNGNPYLSEDHGTTKIEFPSISPFMEPNMLFALNDGTIVGDYDQGEVWLTTDRGNEWTYKPIAQLKSLTRLFRDHDDCLFAIGRYDMYRSHDRGETWQHSMKIQSDVGPQKPFDVDSSNAIYMIDGWKLHRSFDHGRTWLAIDSSELLRGAKSLHASNDEYLYLGTDRRGAFRSTSKRQHPSNSVEAIRAKPMLSASVSGSQLIVQGAASTVYVRICDELGRELLNIPELHIASGQGSVSLAGLSGFCFALVTANGEHCAVKFYLP